MDRSIQIGVISDIYKSAYGFRPSHIDFDSMSDQELLDAEERYYQEAVHTVRQEEKDRKSESAERFEELLLDLIELGASDRATAFKWLVDASRDDLCHWHPDEEFCFEYDLPAEYMEEASALLR